MALPAPSQDELNEHFKEQLELLRKTVNGNIETLTHQRAEIRTLQTEKKDMQQQVSELQQQVLQLQVDKHKNQYNAQIEALRQRVDETEKLSKFLKMHWLKQRY